MEKAANHRNGQTEDETDNAIFSTTRTGRRTSHTNAKLDHALSAIGDVRAGSEGEEDILDLMSSGVDDEDANYEEDDREESSDESDASDMESDETAG